MCACVVLSEIKVDLRFAASAEAFMEDNRCSPETVHTNKLFLRDSDLNEKTRLNANGMRVSGLHMRRCQIKVQFKSGAKKKFLESLFQPMTQILNYQSVP